MDTRRQNTPTSSPLFPSSIEISDDDENSDDTMLGAYEPELADEEFEELIIRPTPLPRNDQERDNHRTSENGYEDLQSYSINGQTLKTMKTVELKDDTFLQITSIIKDRETRGVSVRGLKYTRNEASEYFPDTTENEVTMQLTFDKSDSRSIMEQSIETVELRKILVSHDRFKIRELVRTNRPRPELSFWVVEPSLRGSKEKYHLAHCRLVCRWKQLSINQDEGSIEALTEAEADAGSAMPKERLRYIFRGNTIKGGACPNWLDGEEDFYRTQRMMCRGIDIYDAFSRPTLTLNWRTLRQRYTFGDAFCGAGGASRGAKNAGLRLDWAFDFDRNAIQVYQTNFHGVRIMGMSADQFIVSMVDESFKVDRLHISAPCQPFSPYHVHQGKNDAANQAALFSIGELLDKTTPRVVSVEQTFGIIRLTANVVWFNAMIRLFTERGFSLRWKVFNFAEFGLPQPRRRLIIFASCPGETLPEFPKPTHCKAADQHRFPHLSRFTTIQDVITRIPRGFPLHVPERQTPRTDLPYRGDLPLRRTITTGDQYGHPSGKRKFTLRELAVLQGFGLEHSFGHVRVQKQIGNAVPPNVWTVFEEQIIRTLLKEDGM